VLQDDLGAPVSPDRASVWASPLLRLSGVLAVVGTAWFTVTLVAGEVGPAVIGWLLAPVCAATSTLLCRQAGADPLVPGPARFFWRRAGLAMAVLTLSTVTHFADSVNAGLRMTAHFGVFTGLLNAVGLLLFIWPLFALPLGAGTRAQRVSLWLDVAILAAAAALFCWHFLAREALTASGDRDGSIIAAVVFWVIGLVGVLAIAKVAVTGAVFLERGALRALGGALAVGGAGSTLTMALAERPYLDSSLLIFPIAGFLAALGARRQVVAGPASAWSGGPRRRYSLLPYGAALATGALLVTAVVQRSNDLLPVAVGAVLLTGLVILRQLTSFRENDKLLTRLDAGLLELSRKELRFRLLVQNSTDVVTITDPDGTIRYISPAVWRVLGSDPMPLVGTNIGSRIHPDDQARVEEQAARVAGDPGATATYRARLSHADGSWRHLEVISANLLDEPSVGGIVSNSRDITETLQVQARLSYEASHDVLTGLANRALFGEGVQAAIARAGAGMRISVVLIDLDDFKTVNDTLGHQVGDGLLVAVAERMLKNVRTADTVARLGGDEFAILVEGLDGEALNDMLDRIAVALAEPIHLDGHLLSVRASFGVVDGRSGDDAGDLLRQADIAMYHAKARGEGGYQRYRPGMEARGAKLSRLAAALRVALAEDEFELRYQPVVTLPEGRMTGVEALVRWRHPTRGLLGPDEFIEAAEQTGLIVPLGRWVLREATRQAAAWRCEYGDNAPGSISVNASARQLQDADFAEEVAAALRDHGLPAERLTVEITESTAIGGGATQDTLRALRAMGVRLSLDDFGTGASTLSLLVNCPVDQIKLDRSFAPCAGQDAIATAVVQLAKAFGVEVVAEGVETPAQAAKLRSLGYVRAQGFHFARPMAPALLAATLTKPAGRLAKRP
jgi:diguanylate cyclase (GGDEF)-like protein/PAS domain S-box-containing protein